MNNIALSFIPPLFCSFIIFGAGLIILFNNFTAKLNQLFFGVCLATSTWLTFYALNYIPFTENPSVINFFTRIGYCGVSFISVTFLDYILTFMEHPVRQKILFINFIYGIITAYLILNTNLIVSGLHHYSWGYYPKAGILHPYFLALFLTYCFLSNFLLFKEYRKENISTKKSKQIKSVLTGFAFFTLACWDFIPNYGIDLHPIGYIPATIFICFIFYSIIKHNLMDIEIVLNRSIVYSLLITAITIIYLLFVLLVERFSQNLFHYNSLIVSVLSALIIAIIFVPLKDQIQLLVDRFFLRKTPFELASENQALRATAAQSEKMRILATLSSGIAHEIRNPLTSLKTFIEYFPKKKNDPEFVAKFESIAGSEVARIENILNDLLTFAKPSPLTLTDTDINKTLQHALNLTSNQLKKNNIELKTEFADNLPLIKADANKLIQVFINLILNAIDAMPNGGRLDIKVTKSPPHMSSPHALSGDPLTKMDSRFRSHTATNVNDKNVYITFADSGCGIPKENLSKIFDPFFSTKDSGTGLGLAIVKGIIEEHGGKIAVKSVKDKGTTFLITIPQKGLLNESA